MQPLQYDLRSPAAKDNSITNAATARSNLDAAIYTAGTILQLQITMEFHRQLIHQQHLQSHLHCGNDPTVANHNGILSTAHARKTLETPFTMRNRSDHGPTMVRDRSEHDPTTHETVSHPSHRRGKSSTFEDALCLEKKYGFVHLLSLKNAFRARLPSKLHRQLLHQDHLQSHLQ